MLNLLKKVIFLFVTLFICVQFRVLTDAASTGETTLKEAIDIGLKQAKEWNEKAELTTANSVDETMGGS